MLQRDVLALVLAGGEGGRLKPLTDERAKPHLPFAGTHRLIDFPLSHCLHSGITDVWVVQQHNPRALRSYLANGRPWDLDRTIGGFRILHPFTDPEDENWHEGNAHALYAHADDIREADPEVVVVLSADHVYRLDLRPVIGGHRESGHAVTMVTTEVDDDAGRYGVVEADGDRVTGFEYKPDEPKTSEVATEVFVYDAAVLLDTLDGLVDEHGEDELGDFGEHLIPRLVDEGRAGRFVLEGYWRDVGTLPSYWAGHQDLLGADPVLEVDDVTWPILGQWPHRAAARVQSEATVADSLVSPGSVVAGEVTRSVLGPDVVVEEGAVVRHSVLMDGVRVRRGAEVVGAIVGQHSEIGAGAKVEGDESGEDPAALGDSSRVG